MPTIFERSAGVIPFRLREDRVPQYLVLHSALVRNPRAKWEFPKGTIESGEQTHQTAAREFQEETGLFDWQFVDGFRRSLSYCYVRRGQRIQKTVAYYLARVFDGDTLVRSDEHVPDEFGHWYAWDTFERIDRLLYHAKIRQLFVEADTYLHQLLEQGRLEVLTGVENPDLTIDSAEVPALPAPRQSDVTPHNPIDPPPASRPEPPV